MRTKKGPLHGQETPLCSLSPSPRGHMNKLNRDKRACKKRKLESHFDHSSLSPPLTRPLSLSLSLCVFHLLLLYTLFCRVVRVNRSEWEFLYTHEHFVLTVNVRFVHVVLPCCKMATTHFPFNTQQKYRCNLILFPFVLDT